MIPRTVKAVRTVITSCGWYGGLFLLNGEIRYYIYHKLYINPP